MKFFNLSSEKTGLYLTYLKFEWKRCFSRLGRLLAGLVLLGIICTAAIWGSSFVTGSSEPAASKFTVVFVMPENAGLHYTLALGMVSNMDSVSALTSIRKTTSEEEAMAMLENGEASAVVIIPEGMIHTIMAGTNDLPARIIYPGQLSVETLIFRQIVDNLSQMVAGSQAGIYTLYEIYDRFGADEQEQDTANTQMNELYINTVLDRTALFAEQSLNSAETAGSQRELTDYLASGIALLFLLSGINLCFFFLPSSPEITPSLRRLGLSGVYCLAVDYLTAVLCQWLIFLCLLLLAGAAGLAAGFITAFSFRSAAGAALLCAAFSGALALLICRICGSRQSCIITTFFVSLLLMYCSGCLVPAVFLPDFLRSVSAYLPGNQLTSCIASVLGAASDNAAAGILPAEIMICLLLAALLNSRQERKQVL